MKDTKITIFEGKKIRRHWDEKNEKWWFSVTDIVSVLTRSVDPLAYWRKLKQRLNEEGSETVTKCHGLKMKAADGKMRITDTADTETLFRLIQSIPSPNAEPIKLWLARVGYERVQDISDPEKSLNRARDYWKRMGRSKEWIQQRMMGQEIRNKLTDYWQTHEITKQQEYAILTNIIHKEWSDVTVKEHKKLKNLKTQNLRDHMNDLELIFTMLGERATTEIHRNEDSQGIPKLKQDANVGGKIAGGARRKLERKLGRSIVSKENYLKEPESRKRLKE